jgi:hypothetical protein
MISKTKTNKKSVKNTSTKMTSWLPCNIWGGRRVSERENKKS